MDGTYGTEVVRSDRVIKSVSLKSSEVNITRGRGRLYSESFNHFMNKVVVLQSQMYYNIFFIVIDFEASMSFEALEPHL